MQMPPQHQPPPHQPHPGSQMLHSGLPVSPRNPPSALQGPSTPTLSHTIASPVHPPQHPSSLAHSSNSLGLTSPPPTPSTPLSGANRLDVGSRAFVPRAAAKLTIKNADGTEVSLEKLTKSAPVPPTPAVSSPQSVVLRQGSPGTPNRRPTSIRMETEDQHNSRLAEKEQNDRLKAEAADKEKKEKEKAEAERKDKVAEEVRNLEAAARLEKEQKELRRKQEEERLRKEAEALRLKEEEERRFKLKQEEERILKAKQEEEEKALRLAQEKAKEEKERKEKEEREEQERLSKLAEETRLLLEEEAAAKAKAEAISEPKPEKIEEAELEAHKGDGKQDGQLEDGKDVDTETSKSMEDGKDKPKDGLRINTTSISSPTSNRRRPGPLDLTGARSASPVVAALATARVIADIATVSYPEGYHSPHPDLNQNVKNGKFRYR
jgi:translation initiation factor 4G